MNQGTIVQVIGPVVDADFSSAPELPKIFDALTVEYPLDGHTHKLVLEVQQAVLQPIESCLRVRKAGMVHGRAHLGGSLAGEQAPLLTPGLGQTGLQRA